jgi:magnesium transporter
LEESAIQTVKEVLDYQEKPTVTWFNIDGLHNVLIMEEISKGFNIDRLILADVMDTQARPKVHEYANWIYLSIKMLQQDEETQEIMVENLSLILTEKVLISFQ